MGASVSEFLKLLTGEHRVLVLGGLAVIAHGLSRGTKDADVWLEPMNSSEEWIAVLRNAIERSPHPLEIRCLPGWQALSGEALGSNVAETGIVRVHGLQMPLDIFRRPNQLEESAFDEIWNLASPHEDGTRLPDPIHLLSTKEHTGRERDFADHYFLLLKAREQASAMLMAADVADVEAVLARFFDYEVGRQGLLHPNPEVRPIILAELERLVEEGDLLSAEVLDEYRRGLP